MPDRSPSNPSTRPIASLAGSALTVPALALCLFSQFFFSLRTDTTAARISREVLHALRDPGIQWLALICIAFYFILFTALRFRQTRETFWRLTNPDLWLVSALSIGAIAYATNYTDAAESTQMLVLLGGAALGKAAAVWFSRRRQAFLEPDTFRFLVLLTGMIVLACFWHPQGFQLFYYRDATRWSGPWDNPNRFGLLTGTGVVLAAGLALRSLKSRPWFAGCAATMGAVMSFGLIQSYSRGAWLATGCGLAIPAFARFNRRQSENQTDPPQFPWFKRNWIPLTIAAVSVFTMAFWHFRDTEWLPARRAFSVANLNDFSWRNRVAAWEGALQMMADRPWRGLGWNQVEPMYDHYYRPPKVAESGAIQTNDYLILGCTLGVPALAFFCAFVWLSLTRNAGTEVRESKGPSSILQQPSLSAICRAGAVVLLVGFWFDRGLFNLATAAPFWILLELGRTCTRGAAPAVSRITPLTNWSRAIGVSAAVLFVTALVWAGLRSPVKRAEFWIRTPDGGKTLARVVMPRSKGPFPVAIFSHGAGHNLMSSGSPLRSIADLGLAAVGFDYDKSSQARFNAQMQALLAAIQEQPWARSNAVAWVGNSLGANRQLDCIRTLPELQPQVLVRLAGGPGRSSDTDGTNGKAFSMSDPASPLTCKVWLVHGEKDETFPVSGCLELATALRTHGAPVRTTVLPGCSHSFGPDFLLVVRAAADFCAAQFAAEDFPPAKRSFEGWSFWAAGFFIAIACAFKVWRRKSCTVRRPGPNRRLVLAAAIAFGIAAANTALHVVLPRSTASPGLQSFARGWLVRSDLRQEFDTLIQMPWAREQKLSWLLQHVALGDLQRNFFAPNLDPGTYQQFVLSPWIDHGRTAAWPRRVLWETFYPRVRRETGAMQAARLVVRHLRERVSPHLPPHTPRGPCEDWERGATDRAGFERLYTAALRSLGIPARLGQDAQTELMAEGQWLSAPRPLIEEVSGRTD